jgi:uncharacterized protein YndB with AHSA1/START domain
MNANRDNPAESRFEEEIVISRAFDAPLKLVWEAWSVPERFMRWWGPKGFTSPSCRIDFREGGKYLNCMRSPDGRDYWGTGIYYKIEPMKEIVFSDSFSDENGNVVPAASYGMKGDWPLELLVTLSFEERGGKTGMVLRHHGVPPEVREECETGWAESFDKLAEILEPRPETEG